MEISWDRDIRGKLYVLRSDAGKEPETVTVS